MRRYIAPLVLLAAVLTLVGRTPRAADPPAKPAPKTVRLVIDYGDGVEKHFKAIAWKPEMTVLAALEAAAAGPRPIALAHRGSGEIAFVMKIDDLRNEGGGDGRAWTFKVNGKTAEKSCGIFVLSAGDVVTWTYGVFEPDTDE